MEMDLEIYYEQVAIGAEDIHYSGDIMDAYEESRRENGYENY